MKCKKIAAGILALAMLPQAGLTAHAEASFSRYKHMWSITTGTNALPDPAKTSMGLTAEHNAVLTQSLSNIDLFMAQSLLGSNHNVRYGMTAVSLLATHDLIPYSEYKPEEDLKIPGLFYMTKNGITDEICSLIYYYQILQNCTPMQQYIANQKLTTTSTERLQTLVKLAEAGTPTIVSLNSSVSNYTALAYKAEYGSYEWDGVTYDGMIEVYHPTYQTSHTSFIYFNSQDWSWCVPKGSYGSARGHEIEYICSDPDIINSGGLHQGTDKLPDADFVNILRYFSENTDAESLTFSAIDYADGTWTARDAAPEGSLRSDNYYYYYVGDCGTVFTQETESKISGEIQYEGTRQYVEAGAVSQFVTDPSGYMELTGKNTSYNMQMAFNEGLYTGSWYSMEISGTADTVSLQKTDAGYLLTSDDIDNVMVTAGGRDAQASLVFSADADSVLLYEIDASTIGAAVDTDGDGSYETTIARTGDPSGGTFLMGRNNWLFRNSSQVFGDTYEFTDADRARLEETLSNVERYQAGELMDNAFLGSCYGMAVLSALSCYDLIDCKLYRENTHSLFELGNLTTEMASLINYYSMLQYTEEIWQYMARNMTEKTEAERLQELIANVESGKPTVFCYYGDFNAEGNRSGHAVVAYGIEYGDFPLYVGHTNENGLYVTPTTPTHHMNGRIRIYDNALQHTPNTVSYLYFNTDTNEWYYNGNDSEKNANICMMLPDIDLLNANGILEGTAPYTIETDPLALFFTKALDTEHTMEKIRYDAGTWEVTESTDAEIQAFPLFLTSGETGKAQNFTMTDIDSGYALTLEAAQDLDLEMQYQDILLLAKADKASQAVFHPEGYAEISGAAAPYSLGMIENDGSYTGSWYDFRVSGIGGNASLRRTDEGYILTADELSEIDVQAYGHTAQAGLTFSVPVNSVLLYELDETTIGVKADLDGDGVYETPSQEIPEPTRGDMNADGSVNAADAAEILTAAAKAGTGAGTLSEEMSWRADVNADGTYDASDAALVLQYAAAVGTGSTITPEEFWEGLAG